MKIVVIITVFLILSILRPYQPISSIMTETGDDWCTYSRQAIEIKYNKVPPTPFYGPGGMLYSYFIAGCYLLFGDRSEPVFLIQHLLLALSIILIYLTFEKRIKHKNLFLTLLTIFAILDVAKNYSNKFISENLGIFFVALFIYLLGKSRILSGVSLGLSVLARPNIVFSGVCIAPLLGLGFSISLFSTLLLNSIRNFIVCGKLNILPTMLSIDYIKIFNPNPSIIIYLKKIAFFLGYLPWLAPAYHIRPHWIVMWIGYFLYIKSGIEKKELVIHIFIWSYLFTLMFTNIHNYGFRMVLPIIPTVLSLAFIGYERKLYEKC